MPPTDDETTAAAFFDEWLQPLHEANLRRDTVWFPLGPEPERASYWEAPRTRTGGAERLSIGEADGAALLQRLGQYWFETGEPSLPLLLDSLETLRQRLTETPADLDDDAPKLSYSAYPLF